MSNTSFPTNPLSATTGESTSDTTVAIAGFAVSNGITATVSHQPQRPLPKCETPPQRKFDPQTTHVWNTPFAVIDMPSTVQLADDIIQARKPEYFITANLNYLMLVERYPQLVEVNRHAAAVIADGHPIVLRSRLGLKPLPGRVAGADLIWELAKLSSQRGYSMFLLGAAEGVATQAAATLRTHYPQLQIVGTYSPPFHALNAAETAAMIAQVNRSGADILLVAFGQPKGELWIHEHLAKLNVPLSIQLGASFDFLAGTSKRAPLAWQQLGLEWVYRALSDPRRLGPRYAANSLFLLRRLLGDVSEIFR